MSLDTTFALDGGAEATKWRRRHEYYLKNSQKILARAIEYQRLKRAGKEKRNLQGKVFGQLTVVERGIPPNANQTHKFWLCQCVCGRQVTVRSSHLTSGHTTTCGCPRRKGASSRIGKRNRDAFLALRLIKELKMLIETLIKELPQDTALKEHN